MYPAGAAKLENAVNEQTARLDSFSTNRKLGFFETKDENTWHFNKHLFGLRILAVEFRFYHRIFQFQF